MPAGRPKKLDEKDILDRATTLMWRDGPDAHSLNELAAALGVSKPALSKMFGDKASFQATVLRHYSDQMMGPIAPLLEKCTTVGGVARAFLDHFLEGLSAKPVGPNTGCLLAVTTDAAAVAVGPVHDTALELNAAVHDVLSSALRRVGADEPETLARYLYGQRIAMAHLSRTREDAEGLRDFRNRALAGLPE